MKKQRILAVIIALICMVNVASANTVSDVKSNTSPLIETKYGKFRISDKTTLMYDDKEFFETYLISNGTINVLNMELNNSYKYSYKFQPIKRTTKLTGTKVGAVTIDIAVGNKDTSVSCKASLASYEYTFDYTTYLNDYGYCYSLDAGWIRSYKQIHTTTIGIYTQPTPANNYVSKCVSQLAAATVISR